MQDDKFNYETTAKESLRRVLQEKIEVVRKLSEVEVRWRSNRQHYGHNPVDYTIHIVFKVSYDHVAGHSLVVVKCFFPI